MTESARLRVELANLAAKARRLAAEGETGRTKAQMTIVGAGALRLALDDAQRAAAKALGSGPRGYSR